MPDTFREGDVSPLYAPRLRLSEVWPAVKLMNAFAALGAVDSTATCGDTELLPDEAMGTRVLNVRGSVRAR